MISSGASDAKSTRRAASWLLAAALLLGAAFTARADDCSALPNHTLDGFLTGGVAPSNIKLTFGAPASGHFTTQPYEGVVLVR